MMGDMTAASSGASAPGEATASTASATPGADLADLLRRSARPGDTVLDPFAGSFSTVEACHELKLSCTAVERNASAYGIGVKRVGMLAELERGLL